jgi:ribosome biogenesis GTPase
MPQGSAVDLARIGWNQILAQALAALNSQQGHPARVAEHHRSLYRVHDGRHLFDAQILPALQRRLADADDGLAVGDWVLLEGDGHGGKRITQLLPRSSLLARGHADGSRQRIVANVDTALLVMGLDGDYNPKRLERYLLLVRGAAARPVVLLTKPDRCTGTETEERLHEIQSLSGAQTPVHVLDPRTPEVEQTLAPYLGAGQSLVLLGSSGVGKSTLMNTLMGNDAQRTQATRESDDRGRHTTTSRSLRLLPQGACLIDTPGVRELRLSGEEQLGVDAYEDVQLLAAQCRFNDCKHLSEPGCAVIAQLPPERVAAFHKLQRELAATQLLREQGKRR